MPLRLLVASEGEPDSDGAVRMGGELADAGAQLEVLGVTEPFEFLPGIGGSPPEGFEMVEAMRAEDLRLALIGQMRRLHRESVGCQVEVGEVVETIARRAERDGATAILLGPGKGFAVDFWMRRETSLRLSQRASTPVVRVQAVVQGVPRRVLIGVDFSPASRSAARVALRMMTGKGMVYLVHVVPEKGEEERFPSLIGWRADYERAVEGLLDAMARDLGTPGPIRLETVLVHGDPARELLTLADRMNIDLIAMGSVGAGPGKCGMPGSNAARVFRGPRHSVLLHPAPGGVTPPRESEPPLAR